MSTDSETSTYDYSSDEEAHNYNIDDPFYRGLTLPESMVLETPATNNSTTDPMEQFLCPDCSSALQARRAELAARRRELHVFLLATARPKQSAFVLRHAARALRQIGELVVGPLGSARREEVVCFPSHHFVATPNAAVRNHGVSALPSFGVPPGMTFGPGSHIGGLSHLGREAFIETICYTCLTRIDDAKGFTLSANTLHAVVKSVDGPPEARNPAWGKIFYSLRTPKSVFANMSAEQIQTLGDRGGLRIRVDPE